jgi:hypothetical protein
VSDDPRLDFGNHELSRVRRKRVNWWAVLLLPIFLRAMIPVGFMPMVGSDHRLHLIVCDGYAPVPEAMSMMMDMPAGMPMDAPMGSSGSHGGVPSHEDHGNCPYGAAPTLGGVPALALLPRSLIRRAAVLVIAAPQVGYFEVSPRAQSPRGPPV